MAEQLPNRCICRTVRTQTLMSLMSPPDPEERVPIITSEGALGSNRRPHEYMLNKSKGREREREMLPEGVKRIPFNEEDCLRWRSPRRGDGKPLSHTWKCCLHSRMDAHKGHNYTSCSGALQCDIMWVMYMQPTCKKQIAATVHVSKCQAVDLSCTRKVCLHSEDITKWHHV